MANNSHEQNLIDSFVSALYISNNSEIKIKTLINKNCRAKKYADIEFISESDKLWVIEAKSNQSNDGHNSVHKLFGELLKETGREQRNDCNIAILLPEDGILFYSRLFQSINRQKFLNFGSLIPIKNVFSFGASGILQMSWENLYDKYDNA